MSDPDAGAVLLPIARAAIARELGLNGAAREDEPWLREPGATFVTLTQGEALRGCIGTLQAHRPLLDDVKANAVAAAFRDPRFQPLTSQEFERTQVEVSLLSALERVAVETEQDAIAKIRPGVDGVVLEYGYHRSTYLPQVWEDIPDVADFLAHLKLKAGLPPDFWSPELKLSRYTVSKFREA